MIVSVDVAAGVELPQAAMKVAAINNTTIVGSSPIQQQFARKPYGCLGFDAV